MKLFLPLVVCIALFAGPAVAQSPTSDGPIKGRIVQIIPQGDKTVLVLDKGKKFGVTVGAKGTVDGLRAPQFKVTEVYSFRSKAVIEVKASKLGNARSFQLGGQAAAAPKPKKAR